MSEKKCVICGSPIVFDYVTPTKSYRVENDKIIRDDAWVGPEYDNSYLEFYCSNNREHDIDTMDVMLWTDAVSSKFYEEVRLEEI